MRISLILIFVAMFAVAQETPPRDPRRVTSLPAACSVGQTVFLTTGTTGTYECRTTNTWSRVADGGAASSATNIGGGSAGQFPYQTGAGTTGFRSPNVANGPAVLDANGNLLMGATLLGVDQVTTPSNPASGLKWYVKGPLWCQLTSAGVETCMGAGGGGAFGAVTDGAPITWAIASNVIGNGTVTLAHTTATRALNVTGLANGGFYTLIVKQDATGGAALTAGTGCVWKVGGGGAGAFSISSGANAIDIISFTYDGTNCYANIQTNFN